ncbi:hypothetical protein AAHB34_16210 [Paenarthrobacter ureafaciens]
MITAADSVATPDPTLQIWTLVISGLAALAAIGAGIIAAVSASRRERASWLRQEQTLAYEAFASAAWAALDEFSTGSVAKALAHPEFVGLEESRAVVEGHMPKLFDTSRRIYVVGGSDVIRAVAEYVTMWSTRSLMAIPKTGAIHAVALYQHRDYMAHFADRLMLIASIMRADLGLLSRKGRKDILGRKERLSVLPPVSFEDSLPGEAHGVLIRWRVRRWDNPAQIGPEYTTDAYPWALMNVRHEELFQPLVAVVRKIPNTAWIAAIDSSLTHYQVDQIERDIAALVTTSGHGETRFGGDKWLPGEIEGERLYWWTSAECPPAKAP